MEEDFDIPGGEEMDLGEVKVGEEREIGSNGLKKKLLKEGQGWETPEVGDEVKGNPNHINSSVVFTFLFFFFSFVLICSSLHGDFARRNEVRFKPRQGFSLQLHARARSAISLALL